MSQQLAIFFSSGAFGDCARHALLHALDDDDRVRKVTVYSSERNMPSLDLATYKCGCAIGNDNDNDNGNDGVHIDHGDQFRTAGKVKPDKVEQVIVDVTNAEEMQSRVDLTGVDAVISGLGNRQMFIGDRVARKGTRNVLAAMNRANVHRIVIMTSMGVNEDKPCMEWRTEGKFMSALFNTVSLREYRDLSRMERDVRRAGSEDEDGLNYLLVRPVGLGEECVPRGEYFIQKKKYGDALGPNMAKSDVGKFLLDQAIEPTYNKVAVVIGADPREANASFMEAGLTKQVKGQEGEEKKDERQ